MKVYITHKNDYQFFHQTYVMCTKKKHLGEAFLLHTQRIMVF